MGGLQGVYRPDFYLKQSDIYIEHFGVRKQTTDDGSTILVTAPFVHREQYLIDMDWKRKIHQEKGTTLIETYSYEKVEGQLLKLLEEKLYDYVRPNPIPIETALRDLKKAGYVDYFTNTLAVFLKNFKGMQLSVDDCYKKVDKLNQPFRSRVFLKIFKPLFQAYQTRLGKEIDFEDMINRATKYVETGQYQSPYRHLLIDEFQDISYGRARLIKALKAQHIDCRIFAVGDDWQSIFQFAGSDLSLMHEFSKEFGGRLGSRESVYQRVDLRHTFRSVEEVAEPARRFVLKNPEQIDKEVKTISKTKKSAIIISYYEKNQWEYSLRKCLQSIAASSDNQQKNTVLLLGRYKKMRPKNLQPLKEQYNNLEINFMTVHKAKGLEADHVIILGMASGKDGFPSEIIDDPLLEIVLPKNAEYPHAEERRLFYVALTRAKKSVFLLADKDYPSSFVTELLRDKKYQAIIEK